MFLYVFIETQRRRQFVASITIHYFKVCTGNCSSAKVKYYLRVFTTRERSDETVNLRCLKYSFPLILSNIKRHHFKGIAVFFHNSHFPLSLLLHPLRKCFIIELISSHTLNAFPCLGIANVCVANKLNGLTLYHKHYFAVFLQHQLHVNRLQRHLLKAWLKFYYSRIVNVCPMNIEGKLPPIIVLFVASPHQRCFRMRIYPSFFIQLQ